MTVSGEFRRAELHSIVTPLGVQFVDDVFGTPVSGGLDVWTWPEGVPDLRVPARLAGAATYAAHGLRGLRDFERGDGDDPFWTKWMAEPKRRFVVEARDPDGRFLPIQARVDLPVRGRARPLCAEMLPADRQSVVPLFSASTRLMPATVAVVRAELHDESADIPAAWAVVDARRNGRVIARGLSDRKGRVVLLFAYPEPQASWASPPIAVTSPAAPMPPLSEQRWTIDIAVRYDRSLLRHAAAAGNDPEAAIRDVPDLCDALAQAPAQAVADAAISSSGATAITLRYGETAVLRTANTLGKARGRLLVVTRGSPL